MAKSALAPAREGEPSQRVARAPFALMRSLSDEMDRLFGDIGARWPFAAREREGLWSPAVEVEEREGKLLVRADLPGLTKDDVKVEVTDDYLTIEGERKQEKEEKKEGYYRSERSYGSFYRSIALPEGAKGESAKATFKDGVLEVAVDLATQPRPSARRVEIEGSSQTKGA